MDVLDKYKQAWQNQPEDAKKILKQEIFEMAHAKSSSIVKWIFIMGLVELGLFIITYLFMDLEKAYELYEQLGLRNFAYALQIISFTVFGYFLFKFYKNYKSISTTDATKDLMSKILKTRKSVKTYVIINLVLISLTIITVGLASYIEIQESLTDGKLMLFVLLMVGLLIAFIGIIWLFYQLLYGFLLRKLRINYKELSKLEE